MATDDVLTYIARLEAKGLRYLRDGQAQDIAIANQWDGIESPCDWLEFGHMSDDDKRVAVCRLVGSRETMIFLPEGWTYEGSATQTLRRFAGDDIAKSLEYVERQGGGLDVYRDRLTGKLLYVGRTDDKGENRR